MRPPPLRTDEPELVRGTLTTFRRRCGKPGCRCATGDPHESPALTYWEDGRTKTLTLRPGEVAVVEGALRRYAAAKARLEDDADRGIEALRQRRAAGRGVPRRRRPSGGR